MIGDVCASSGCTHMSITKLFSIYHATTHQLHKPHIQSLLSNIDEYNVNSKHIITNWINRKAGCGNREICICIWKKEKDRERERAKERNIVFNNKYYRQIIIYGILAFKDNAFYVNLSLCKSLFSSTVEQRLCIAEDCKKKGKKNKLARDDFICSQGCGALCTRPYRERFIETIRAPAYLGASLPDSRLT